MATSRFVDPPQEVQNKLEQLLQKHYPDLQSKLNQSVFRSIVYDSGKHPVRYHAEITYCHGQSSSIASFSYQENKESREFYWYCTRDWQD